MAGRLKAPKCAGCGKALYRTEYAGEVRDDDEFAYCRNEKCEYYGDIRKHSKKSKKTQEKAVVPSVLDSTQIEKESTTDVTPPLDIKPLCEQCGKVKCECENRHITETREGIRKALVNEQARELIAASATAMLRELGDHDLANRMIDRYTLDAKYNMAKVFYEKLWCEK